VKVAIIFAGQPRFCADFDSQLLNLQQASCIDWYSAFWNQGKNAAFESQKDKWVSPSWQFVDAQSAMRWIYPRIPQNHRILSLELKTPEQFPVMPEHPPLSCHSLALWGQYQILQFAAHQIKKSGITYDLIIRSRVDIGLTKPLDLQKCKQYLDTHPQEILIPANGRHGPAMFADQFAIGLPQAMIKYTNAVNHFEEAFQKGVPWNPEYILGMALLWQGISWPMNDINNTLRKIGEGQGSDFLPHWGRWI